MPRAGLSFILSSVSSALMSKSKPLWKPEDQSARLAELTAQSDEAAKDNPLRRDVRSLGVLLGQVLVQQAGQEVFEGVEKLRQLLIKHRDEMRKSPAASAKSK